MLYIKQTKLRFCWYLCLLKYKKNIFRVFLKNNEMMAPYVLKQKCENQYAKQFKSDQCMLTSKFDLV